MQQLPCRAGVRCVACGQLQQSRVQQHPVVGVRECSCRRASVSGCLRWALSVCLCVQTQTGSNLVCSAQQCPLSLQSWMLNDTHIVSIYIRIYIYATCDSLRVRHSVVIPHPGKEANVSISRCCPADKRTPSARGARGAEQVELHTAALPPKPRAPSPIRFLATSPSCEVENGGCKRW